MKYLHKNIVFILFALISSSLTLADSSAILKNRLKFVKSRYYKYNNRKYTFFDCETLHLQNAKDLIVVYYKCDKDDTMLLDLWQLNNSNSLICIKNAICDMEDGPLRLKGDVGYDMFISFITQNKIYLLVRGGLSSGKITAVDKYLYSSNIITFISRTYSIRDKSNYQVKRIDDNLAALKPFFATNNLNETLKGKINSQIKLWKLINENTGTTNSGLKITIDLLGENISKSNLTIKISFVNTSNKSLNLLNQFKHTRIFFSFKIFDDKGGELVLPSGGKISFRKNDFKYINLLPGNKYTLQINLAEKFSDYLAQLKKGKYTILVAYLNQYGRNCFKGVAWSNIKSFNLTF